ncbi:MAG TPA: hypothetical protein VHO24_03220 [Opitutaceae bacterium]|nr:hypothetical protein [Opitutaceae bacterium]
MFKTSLFSLKLRCLIAGALLLGTLAGGCSKQTRSAAEREAEARALYDRANLYVQKIGEGEYSYEYINFHYLQAMDNVNRILTAYPETDYGQKLKRNELKLGKYTLEYFRTTLLAQLGDMKEATESMENCAIYLRSLPDANSQSAREALALILETLCRKVRSDEALIFPTLPEDRTFAKETIVRVMTRYLQKDVALSLVQSAEVDERPILAAAYGEGMAVGGLDLKELEEWTARYATPDKRVETAILRGMVEREGITFRDSYDKVKKKQRADALAALKAAGKEEAKPKKPSTRYDIPAYYQQKFGTNSNPEAVTAMAGLKALQGEIDEARTMVSKLDESALVKVIANYYDHLGVTGILTGREDLHRKLLRAPDNQARAQAKLVEYLAQNAKYPEADALKDDGIARFPQFRDLFIRSRIKGVFYSREELFYLTARTIPALDIKDPGVCAVVLLEWVLSPNRLQKGSSWGADQILFKYFSIQKEGRPISRKLYKG